MQHASPKGLTSAHRTLLWPSFVNRPRGRFRTRADRGSELSMMALISPPGSAAASAQQQPRCATGQGMRMKWGRFSSRRITPIAGPDFPADTHFGKCITCSAAARIVMTDLRMMGGNRPGDRVILRC